MTTVKTILLLVIFPMLCFGQSPKDKMAMNGWEEEAEPVQLDIIHPNPTYGMLNLNFDLVQRDVVQVVISDILAKTIWSQQVKRSQDPLNLGFLNKGTYLLSIKELDGETIATRRLMIIVP